MELWLLGAGAIVLIAITLWIVWPARTADAADTSVQAEEVTRTPMSENVGSVMPPQGDRFEDQYTSATADLSAGGVATARESMAGQAASEPPPMASSPTSHRWAPAGATDYSTPLSMPTDNRSSRTMGFGAGAILSIGGAIGGAWLYARWQRERNKPINRLRRGARDVTSRIGERLPDVEDLPHGAAPMSGAATALLLTGLLATRALRRDSTDRAEELSDQASDLRDQASDLLKRGRKESRDQASDLLKRGRKESRRFASRLPTDRMPEQVEAPRPAMMGFGFGGLAILVAGTYLVWRVLRGGGTNTSWTAYAGE
jgi:hypothetical protein